MSDTITLSEADLFVRATLTWTPDPENPQPATINYVTRNGTAVAGEDYTAGSGTLTWAAGEGGSKSFDIPIIDDDAVEGDETFFIDISGNFNATVTVTLTDNDRAMLSIAGGTANEGDPVQFTLTLDKPLDHDVTVTYATSDSAALAGQDYETTTGTVVIQAGQTSANFAVATIEDATQETLLEAFNAAFLADDPQVDFTTNTTSGFIRDDDGVNDPNYQPPPRPGGGGGGGGPGGGGGGGNDDHPPPPPPPPPPPTGSLNKSPVAKDDTFNTREDTPIVIKVSDLLKNDYDPDPRYGDPGIRLIEIDTQNSHTGGKVFWNQEAGTITYTPPADAHGTDFFQYKISDPRGAQDKAVVTINIANADFDVVRIGIEQLSPNRHTVSDTNGNNEALVGIGPEVTGGDLFTIDVSGNQIVIDFNRDFTFADVPFVGYHIYDKYKVVPDIRDVALASDNISGFDGSDIDFKKNDIWINWADMSVTADSRIVLDVVFA